MNRATGYALLLAALGCAAPAAPLLTPLPDLRTVDSALTVAIVKGAQTKTDQHAWLGVHLAVAGSRLVVADVAPDSPAAKAGLLRGDLLLSVGGDEPGDGEAFREIVQALAPGEKLRLVIGREGREIKAAIALGSVSRPLKAPDQRALLGVRVGEAGGGEGTPITRLTSGMPAEKAGLKVGDRILRIDGATITDPAKLTETLASRSPGESVTVAVHRSGRTDELKMVLVADPYEAEGSFRGGSIWKREVYRLAVVPVEYPDVKRNEKIGLKEWVESLFSRGTYVNRKNASGREVWGSLNDYYLEQSCSVFHVEGKVFDWVAVSKKRPDYAPGSGTSKKSVLLVEAVDKLLEREGKEALKDYDGIFILYAGDRVQSERGGLYWPHRGSFTHQGKRWPYFIVQEGGARMTSISVICHEFGHMLGLPDLYARPENPGSEGLGNWCAMSDHLAGGRPQHLSAWCKEQMGWLKPAVLDPAVKQRLSLGPVEGSTKECFKVLVRPDGGEYLLLENRRKTGFDRDLPAEGLLIWRVVGNRPVLEESHGVEGPSGPRVHIPSVPYPSGANDAFTPHTAPSSRGLLGGGRPVHITNIRRGEEGRITFSIGFEYD